MKKIFNIIPLVVAFAILTGWIAACSNESEKELSSSTFEMEQSEAVQILSNYNDELTSNGATRGLTTGQWIWVAIKDAKGAYKGGKTGGRIGGLFGPHGATAGAVIGGAVVGGMASYIQYNKFENEKATLTERAPNLNPNKLTIESVAGCFVLNKENIIHQDYYLGFNNGLDSCASLTGILHNKILDGIEFIKDKSVNNDVNSKLSEVEKYVIESDELTDLYLSLFDENKSALDLAEEAPDEADIIMNLFIDAVEKNATSEYELQEIIRFYVNVVENSTTLSKENKESLFGAFSVMGYSYQYWAKKLKQVEE